MARRRSDETTPGATADQSLGHDEDPYTPSNDRGGDRPGEDDHEEPIDGPEPEPEDEG